MTAAAPRNRACSRSCSGRSSLTRFDLWPATLTLAALAALVWRAGPPRLRPPRRGGRREALPRRPRPARRSPTSGAGAAAARHSCASACSAGVVVLAFLPVPRPGAGRRRAQHRQAAQPAAADREPRLRALPGRAPGRGDRHRDALEPRLAEPRGNRPRRRRGPAQPRPARRLVWIWLRRAGDGRGAHSLERAAVVAFVALGKVLSPQFLIWLALLVPLVGGRRGAPRLGAPRRARSS